VKVESSGPTTVQTNEFDGLNRRIVRVDAGNSDTYDSFYNEAWQLLEERKDGDADPLNQFVWNADYIDSLALRYYDSDTDSTWPRARTASTITRMMRTTTSRPC
jgi:hypothetical protein